MRQLPFLAQGESDRFRVAVTLSGGRTLHLSSYNTDDMVANGNFFLERFPLSSTLSQQLGSPAIILLLRKAEAASENTFALIGLWLRRVDMLWLNSELLNSTRVLRNKNEDERKVWTSSLTHIWLNSPLFLVRRQIRYDRVPFIT